jgi:hypothetical protein
LSEEATVAGFRVVLVACGVLACVALHRTDVLYAQPPTAQAVVTAAREALGGERRLSAVTSFTATGRTRQIRGNNLVPSEFEINCELPDKFVRKDEIPAQDTDASVTGFTGDALILFPAPQGRAGGPPPQAVAQQRLVGIRQDFARLMLGAFAASFPPYPLTFKYLAEGDAPEGKADILDVAGPASFSARLVIQRDTHLPVMLMWQVPAPGPPGTPPMPVEHRLYYGDFRDVNGMKWPFRLRHAVAGETTEETTFDRVRINVKIDARKFEVPK